MTRTLRTLIAGCAAVPLLAGAALAEPVTPALVTELLGSQFVSGGAVPAGQHLQFRGFQVSGSSYRIDAAALLVPAQRDGKLAFLLEDATLTRIDAEGGGISAVSLQGTDISLLRGMLDDSFLGAACDGAFSEVLIEGQDVQFWADGDLSAGGRASREAMQLGHVQARVAQGAGCSELIEVTAAGVKTQTPTGGFATVEELSYATRAGTESAVGLLASGLRLEGQTGLEVLSLNDLSLQASFSRPFHEIIRLDQDPFATLVEELRVAMVDVSIGGLRSRLDLLVPGGRIGGFVIPAGHALEGDLQFSVNGSPDGVAIAGASAMDGLGDMQLETVLTFSEQAADPMSTLAQMQIGASTLSLKDRGLDDLLIAAKGYDAAELVRRGLSKVAALAPGGTGRALEGVSEGIASWIGSAMRDGGSVSIDPQPAVTPFEVGMMAMSAPSMLPTRLGLQTGSAD